MKECGSNRSLMIRRLETFQIQDLVTLIIFLYEMSAIEMFFSIGKVQSIL